MPMKKSSIHFGTKGMVTNREHKRELCSLLVKTLIQTCFSPLSVHATDWYINLKVVQMKDQEDRSYYQSQTFHLRGQIRYRSATRKMQLQQQLLNQDKLQAYLFANQFLPQKFSGFKHVRNIVERSQLFSVLRIKIKAKISLGYCK